MERDLFEEFESDGAAEVSCVMTGEIECRGEVGERGYGGGTLVLCKAHMYVLAAWRNEQTAAEVSRIYEDGLATEHSEGLTYSIEMANGNAKTGMTTRKTLGRLIRVSKEHNGGKPVKILALFEGGRTRELLAHHQWRDIRVPDQMEQFKLTPEYRAWAEAQGIPEKYRAMVEEHETTVEEKLARVAFQNDTGYVLAVRLDNGNVLISHTTKSNLDALRDLNRSRNGGNPVKVLAIVEGGIQAKKDFLREWRDASALYGELRPEPNVMSRLSEWGISPQMAREVSKYNERHTKPRDLFEED